MLIDIQTKGTAEINDPINECELGTHQCSENAACQDLKVCKLNCTQPFWSLNQAPARRRRPEIS